MSGDLLREAATLMRSRAEGTEPGPWLLSDDGVVSGGTLLLFADTEEQRRDAEHIASWHPAVALAVADFLDGEAAVTDEWTKALDDTDDDLDECVLNGHRPPNPHATRIARAYLGRPA